MKTKLFPLLFICVAFLLGRPLPGSAGTAYYVDADRTSNGTGAMASPWTNWSAISWTSVSNSLSNGPVTIYFSSRCTVAYTGNFSPKANGLSANQMIQFIGDAFYNTNTTGTAVWYAETNGNRVLFTGALSGTNYYGGSVELYCNNYFLSFKGIHITNSAYACICCNPAPGTIMTTNLHDIYITNCCLDTPISQHGFYGGYLETNCYNFVISSCQISNTLNEPIYIGHYCYFEQTITNVIIESNLIVNCGRGATAYHQGQINLKPGVCGAIVRYNTKIYTLTSMHGGSSGVECFGDSNQIYGNTFINELPAYDGSWGNGIMLIADGDQADAPTSNGVVFIGPGEGNPAWVNGQGSPITSCLIYNNLIVNCQNDGIIAYATTTNVPGGASIAGVQIWNNTIWGCKTNAIYASIDAPQTMSISQMYNNIIGNSGGIDINLPMNVTLLSVDHNLYWRPSGTIWYYGRSYAVSSFAAWQALGFDLNGTNAAPIFVNSTSSNPFLLNFNLQSGSPGISMGTPSPFFDTDMFQNSRPAANWELGPFQLANLLAPPTNLRIMTQ